MIKATFNVEKAYCRNKIFFTANNEYNLWKKIKENLYEEGIDLSTQDINPPERSELVIDLNVPSKFRDYQCKRYLLQIECEVILKRNYNKKILDKYDIIFTWNEDLIDNLKYLKINYPQSNTIEDFNSLDFNEKKLCTLVAANKYYRHKGELYSERLRAIKWFENNHPADFDFYGYDWDKLRFKGLLSAFNEPVSKINIPSVSKFSTYGGSVDIKRDILKRYKFSICYENAGSFPGYLTEKIFDCFHAKNVPVYLGAPDILDLIPGDTFIDRRNFSSYEDLFDYLANMKKDEYDQYLNKSDEFLRSPGYSEFKSSRFVDIISGNILKDFNS